MLTTSSRASSALATNRKKAMSTTSQTAPTQSVDVNGTKLVFREIGSKGGVPVVLLHHLTAALDDWLRGSHSRDVRGDGERCRRLHRRPGIRQGRPVGLSQVVAQQQPGLVRKIILAGTGPAGGAGIVKVGAVLQDALGKAGASNKHPKQFLFFTQTKNGQSAADDFLQRLKERARDLDAPVSNETVQAQIAAIHAWGQGDASALATVQHPVLVVNGDDDVMVPTLNSFELARRLPYAQLSIFPDAGHGGIFQYHATFLQQALAFLSAR
jgi:TAP-like protein